MERLKALDRYQKCILLLMLVMLPVFAVLYHITVSRIGFEYAGALLVPTQENGATVYSGKLKGTPAQFTVTADKTVTFQYGDKSYGPYTAREDPAAVPQAHEGAADMRGVELRRGDTVLFRGGVLETNGAPWLYQADGTPAFFSFQPFDEETMEPTADTVLELMDGPALTHKGKVAFSCWSYTLLLCGLNTVSILYEKELFRWHMSFHIRGADRAEPTELERIRWRIGYALLLSSALVLLILGLYT